MDVLEAVQQVREVFALAGIDIDVRPSDCSLNTASPRQTLFITKLNARFREGRPAIAKSPKQIFEECGIRVVDYTNGGAIMPGGDTATILGLHLEFPPPHPQLNEDVEALAKALLKLKPGDTFVLPSGTEIKIMRLRMKDDALRTQMEEWLNEHDNGIAKTAVPTEPPKPEEPPSLHRRAVDFFTNDVREKKR